jgi:hypothetical protein
MPPQTLLYVVGFTLFVVALMRRYWYFFLPNRESKLFFADTTQICLCHKFYTGADDII